MSTILLDAPARIPQTRDDWGDESTIGIHLRRRRPLEGDDLNEMFAVFLGGTSVGLKDFWTWRIREVTCYASVQEMKSAWEAD